jgi:hypothetical protein
VIDKPSAYAKVHKVELFEHVVKEIENLERYYEAKVLAGGSTVNTTTLTVHFGSKPQTYSLIFLIGGVTILPARKKGVIYTMILPIFLWPEMI